MSCTTGRIRRQTRLLASSSAPMLPTPLVGRAAWEAPVGVPREEAQAAPAVTVARDHRRTVLVAAAGGATGVYAAPGFAPLAQTAANLLVLAPGGGGAQLAPSARVAATPA
jgi:hypothetical protein